MLRGLISGLFWGALLALVVLVAVTELRPVPLESLPGEAPQAEVSPVEADDLQGDADTSALPAEVSEPAAGEAMSASTTPPAANAREEPAAGPDEPGGTAATGDSPPPTGSAGLNDVIVVEGEASTVTDPGSTVRPGDDGLPESGADAEPEMSIDEGGTGSNPGAERAPDASVTPDDPPDAAD